MKSRRNRTTIQKTRKVRKITKQKGGGVLSKPLRQKQNVNLSEYLSAQPTESLPAKNQMAYHTTKKKIEVRTKELDELNSNVGLGAGAGVGAESRKKALREELNQLKQKMNTFSGTKNVVTRLPLKNYGQEQLGTVNAKLYRWNRNTRTHVFLKEETRPVEHYRFKISPEFGNVSPFGQAGPQYTHFQKKLMPQIYLLRAEAFPEEYGRDSDGLNKRLLNVFGKSSSSTMMENGILKSTVSPYSNAEHILFESPIHCEKKPGTLSTINFVDSLYFFTEEELKKEKNYKSMGSTIKPEPSLISSCAYTLCELPSGVNIAELVGVATFEKYQGQGFASKMLRKVFNYLSTIGSVNIKISKGEVATNSNDTVEYVWLYYDRTNPELGDFYESFGFKELTEKETDPERKELYIGKKFLLDAAKKNKWAKFKAEAIEEHRKITYQPLEFVDENEFVAWTIKKREELYNTWGKFKKPDGSPIKDNYTEKTIDDFPSEEEYKQAIFEAWGKLKVNYPMIITQEVKEDLNTLTKEEEYEALEFERDNVQMVLSMADWVYEMNKMTN